MPLDLMCSLQGMRCYLLCECGLVRQRFQDGPMLPIWAPVPITPLHNQTSLQLQTRMKLRGCKEVFEANEELLAEGRVDFVPAKQITAEDEARREAEEAEAARAVR